MSVSVMTVYAMAADTIVAMTAPVTMASPPLAVSAHTLRQSDGRGWSGTGVSAT